MCSLEATTPQLKVVKDFLDSYGTLSINNAAPYISKNYKFQTLPKVDGRPEEEKGRHPERHEAMLSLLKGAELDIHEVIEAPGKVVIHLSAVFHAVGGAVFDYDSLSIFTVVEEDGQLKVAGLKDFSDPEKRSKILVWLSQALAKGLPAA